MRHDQPNEKTGHRAESQKGPPGFRDDGALRTQEHADKETNDPTRRAEINHADDKPKSEPIEKSRCERRPLIGESQGKHQTDGKSPESQASNETESDVGHQGAPESISGLTDRA